MLESFIDKYAKVIVKRPFIVLAVMLLLFSAFLYGATKVDTISQKTEDFLPESIKSVEAYDTITAEFGSAEGTTFTVLLETSPEYANSNEVRDIRNPRVIHYVKSVTDDLSEDERIASVSGVDELFATIPSSLAETKDVLSRMDRSIWSNYISEGYTSTKVRITTYDITQEEKEKIADTIKETFRVHDKPPGIKTSYTGQIYIDQAFRSQTKNTMAITSMASIIGVLVVVVILFRSFYDGFTSLTALLFGTVAGYGIFGYLDFNMSPATSGALSIGIGIAIDFGIQTVSRYREEVDKSGLTSAVAKTLGGVASPMSIALVSAVIGFTTLSMGKLTFLSKLGTLLSLTTASAFFAAFTIIPVILVIYDKKITKPDKGGEKNE